MEPVIIHARVADEADVIAILAELVDVAIGFQDCEMVAYIQVAVPVGETRGGAGAGAALRLCGERSRDKSYDKWAFAAIPRSRTMTSAPFEDASAKSFHQSLRDAGSLVTALRGEMLCDEGVNKPHVLLLESGFVMAVKRTADGEQQNVAIYLPGDLVGHESYTLGSSRCGAIALTATTYHRVSHAKLRDLMESDPGHSAAFWRYVAFHGALAHDWLLSLGRRSAYARTAHLLCEIVLRTGVDHGDTSSCPLPLTQSELADTLGLSIVHVNRTLQSLRREGLIKLRAGRLDVLDWPRLKMAAGFKPDYLSSWPS